MFPTAAGPLPPPPRRVRRRPDWQRNVTRWIALPLLGVGFLAGGYATVQLAVTVLGTRVTATVDRLTTIPGDSDSGETYRATYHYVLAGHTHAGAGQVSGGLHARLTPGSAVPALAVRLPGGRAYGVVIDPGLARLYAGFALLWNAVMIPVAVWLYVTPARRRRLLRTGDVVAGQVTVVGPWDAESASAWVSYTYHPPGQPAAAGRQSYAGPPELLPHPGDAVTVVYDPARPRRSVAYEAGEFAVVWPPGPAARREPPPPARRPPIVRP